MSIKIMSVTELGADMDGARAATKDGLVIITEEGRPTYVLMSIEDFTRLEGAHKYSEHLSGMLDAQTDRDQSG